MGSLRKGEACEFEIFIKPLCSCQLEDEIRLIVLDIKEGKERQLPMKILIKTKQSSHLDYDEIQLERKLGEGSFGVIYLGMLGESKGVRRRYHFAFASWRR